VKSERSLYERNRAALKEFLAYRKQKEAKEKLQEALAYYEENYCFDDGENEDNRTHRYM